MEVIDNTALKFKLPAELANTVTQGIEKSLVNQAHGDDAEVLMHWSLRECSTLAQILDRHAPDPSLPKVLSPIFKDYKWPGLFTPFEHQKTTAGFLSIRPRAFCFNEAGTGKTSAAIWAADYLMSLGIIRRVLVICPLSIMHTAWQSDILSTAMHRSCGIAHGSADKRKRVIQSNFDFVVINFDGTGVVFNELVNGGFDLIIVDECNAYKNASTKRWKTLAKLIMPTTWLWMMTGTPASQSPLDAFGLARLVSPSRVPKFATAWRDKVMRQISKFKWMPKDTSQREVFHALQPAIRFTKKECLDLPPVVYQTREVPMTPQTSKYYYTLKKQLLIETAGVQITAVNAAAALTKLLQISGGAVYTDDIEILEFDIRPRLTALQEVLDETTNKVVIFVPYLHTVPTIVSYLREAGETCEIIQGDVSANRRREIFQQFQTKSTPRVLVVQPQSASHGVTLTAADTIVFWGPVMSVETYIQCIGRIDRVGQKNKMTVVHLQSSEVERRLYSLLQGKVSSHQQIVDLYKHVISESPIQEE